MNSFRTEINCLPASPIRLDQKILTMGSCFADQFGQWLAQNKFQVLVNPFGTAYNPLSIHSLLLDSLTNTLDATLFIERHSHWFHHQWHSQFTAQSKEELSARLQAVQNQVQDFLHQTDVLVLTYGTAWVYELKASTQLVSNCHKVPAAQFRKRLLSVSEIVASFKVVSEVLKKLRPNLRIVLTVSPVRHLKDTLELNAVSKAVLRIACNELNALTEYFPAYEILTDDLRDYRFYERDMIHPSAEARDYINQKFSDRYFDSETRALLTTLHEIQKALAHKPFQPSSAAHQLFLKDTLRKVESIQHRVPVIQELEHLRTQLR
ncbi:MAG: GSCFA domain-containing protein [Cyclobacteriaceae bacterium]|nr:GSCFA domain-containing protein [Cyclobacteriaceae bacterium]